MPYKHRLSGHPLAAHVAVNDAFAEVTRLLLSSNPSRWNENKKRQYNRVRNKYLSAIKNT